MNSLKLSWLGAFSRPRRFRSIFPSPATGDLFLEVRWAGGRTFQLSTIKLIDVNNTSSKIINIKLFFLQCKSYFIIIHYVFNIISIHFFSMFHPLVFPGYISQDEGRIPKIYKLVYVG